MKVHMVRALVCTHARTCVHVCTHVRPCVHALHMCAHVLVNMRAAGG